MRLRLSVWSLLGLFVLLAGCGSKGAKGTPSGDVAATVNDETIPVTEVTKVAANFVQQGVQPDSTARGTTPEEKLYYTVVDRLVEQALVLQESKQEGLDVTDQDVEDGIGQLKMMAGGEEGYQKLLADHSLTQADIEKDMRTNLVMKKFFDKVNGSAPQVTDEDIQKFYDENPQHFAPQPQVHAAHILIRNGNTDMLIRTRPDMTDMEKANARQRAESLLKKAKGGEDFADLARKNSEDEGSAPTGGDLDWFGHGQMVAPFDSVAFALSPGEVGGVVEIQFGYHVIKVDSTRMSEALPLDKVKEQIRGMLAQQKSQDAFRKAIEDLKAKGKVTVTPPSAETLAALKTAEG
jgi:parvulin-like peptidyl-prolyl isomerase